MGLWPSLFFHQAKKDIQGLGERGGKKGGGGGPLSPVGQMGAQAG